MTLKQIIEEKNVTGFETVQNLVLNVEVGEELYQLDVDTSNLEAGLLLEKHLNFIITDTMVIVNNIEVSLDIEIV